MKKVLALVVLVMVLGMAVMAQAESVSGKVEAIDLTASTISVMGAEAAAPVVVTVNDMTKITKAEVSVKLADVAQGTEATVEYAADASGVLVASSVSLK